MALQREEVLKQGMENVLNYIKDLEKRIVALEDIIEDITEDIPVEGYNASQDVENLVVRGFVPRSWASQAKV